MLRKLLVLVCLAGATNAIAQNTYSPIPKTTEKKNDTSMDYKQVGAPMPSLMMIPYYNNTGKKKEGKGYINNGDLNNDANLFVMMFNPTCSHCQDQTLKFEDNISLFKKTKLVLLANKVMQPYLGDFVKQMHLDHYPSIYLGTDSTDFINTVFLYQSLPQINIYSSDRKLIRSYTGEVPMDSLKKYIE